MKENAVRKIYTSYDELPIMLSVPQLAAVLNISRSGAYALVRSDGFPSLKIGSRIVIPKDKLQNWINENCLANLLDIPPLLWYMLRLRRE